MVKDHSNSDRGNPLPPHGLLFPISSKGSFICPITAHTIVFVIPAVAGIDPTSVGRCSSMDVHLVNCVIRLQTTVLSCGNFDG